MKKLSLMISLLIVCLLPAISPAAQKAQKTTTSYSYDKAFGVTTLVVGGAAGSTASTTTPSGSSAMNTVVNTSSAISVDAASGTINLINSNNYASGSVWYANTTTNTCNPCTNGQCPFGIGFRAYFEFKTQVDSSPRSDVGGDGFTFAVVNAYTATNTGGNTIADRGGVPTNGFDIGSLLGYAGPGDTEDKLGLTPPKFAVEFDLYPNNTADNTYAPCSSARNDNNHSYDTNGANGSTSNHLALMFWGANPASTTMCDRNSAAGNTYPKAPMDDTYHSAGDGSTSNPYNSAVSGNGSGLGGYYERSRSSNGGTYNWMEDNKWHRARIEVIRNPTAYTYQIKVWVDCETTSGSTTCPAGEYVYFQDIYTPYNTCTGTCTGTVCSNGTGSCYLPKINRTVTLTQTYSSMLDTILFGFTEGSGLVTQNVSIANFAVYFPPRTAGCTYTVGTPSNLSFTAGGGSGTVSVTATSGCCWTTSNNNNAWITLTPAGSSGTGAAQTVNFTVDANTGPVRNGTITIAGRDFTINQAAIPPACTLTAGNSIVAYNGTNTLTWTVTGTPTSATWSASPGGTCGSPNIAGGSCTTANQTTAGVRNYTLNVSNANGSGSCSAEFYVGCQNYRVWNARGARYDFRVGTQCANNSNNGSEITSAGSNRYLNTGETITQYTTNSGSCGGSTAGGATLTYTQAMSVDIGGNRNCQVNFTGNGTATDR